MKLKEFKEVMIKNLAVTAMEALASIIKVIDKVKKQETDDIRFYKIKTENYHVRLLVDTSINDRLILVRPKGFLKEWTWINGCDIPKCIPTNIFDDSCTEEQRKRLVNKIVELRAFW